MLLTNLANALGEAFDILAELLPADHAALERIGDALAKAETTLAAAQLEGLSHV